MRVIHGSRQVNVDPVAGKPAAVALAGFVPIYHVDIFMLLGGLGDQAISGALPAAGNSGIDSENVPVTNRFQDRINIGLGWRAVGTQVNDDIVG